MTRPTRVLMVVASLATADGGPVEAVRRLMDFLPSHHIDLHVITTDRRLGPERDTLDPSMVTIVPSKPPARYNFAPGIGRAIGTRLPATDVVHIHAVDTYPTTVAARLSRRAKIPFLLQPHGAYDDYHRRQNPTVKALYLRTVDRRNFAAATDVITSTVREADGVRAIFGCESTVVPLGVDPKLFSLSRVTNPSPQVLFLGRLTVKKSVDFAIEAFAVSGAADRGAKLVIAGPRDHRLPYDPADVALRAGVADSVEFRGVVDAAQRASLLACSDLFVLPSRDESFGVSVAEALAAGCAVISSPEVGLAPAVAAAGGLRMVSRDVRRWGDEIRLLCDESDVRGELSRSGRAYASETFTWEKIAGSFARIYRTVNGGPRLQ